MFEDFTVGIQHFAEIKMDYAAYKRTLPAAIGANLFGGDKTTTFLGQFGRDDNAYLTLRYDFQSSFRDLQSRLSELITLFIESKMRCNRLKNNN